MNCSQCGKAVLVGAHFCVNCGAKVSSKPASGLKLALAEIPSPLKKCEIEITEAQGEGPDDDGDIRIQVKFQVTNDSDRDWEYLISRVQILDSNGVVVEETRDTFEQTVCVDDFGEFETFLSVKLVTLGETPEQCVVLVSVIACGMVFHKFGEFNVPSEAFLRLSFPAVNLDGVIQVISGSLWRGEVDEDSDSRVYSKVLVQNLTDLHLHEVKLIGNIKDRAGREVTDSGGAEEIRAGEICVIGGTGYAKDRQFLNAKVDMAIRGYFTVAVGYSVRTGLEVTESD